MQSYNVYTMLDKRAHHQTLPLFTPLCKEHVTSQTGTQENRTNRRNDEKKRTHTNHPAIPTLPSNRRRYQKQASKRAVDRVKNENVQRGKTGMRITDESTTTLGAPPPQGMCGSPISPYAKGGTHFETSADDALSLAAGAAAAFVA